MAEKTQIAEPKESNEAKSDSTERSARENPFAAAAVESQAGKIERAKDPQADQIIKGDKDGAGSVKAATPDEMSSKVSEGKKSLDALAKVAGKQSGGPGWDDFVKGLSNNPLDNSSNNNKMVKALQDAYKTGGKDAVETLMDQTNSKIVGPFGPTVKFNADKTATLTIQEQDPKDINKIWDISKPVTFKLEANDKPNPAALTTDKNPAAIASGFGLAKAFSELARVAPGDWKPTSDTQKAAMDFVKENAGDLSKIPSKMLDALASTDTNALNKFLKDRGYDIQLKPLSGKDAVGVVTSVELEGQWSGKNYGNLSSDGKEYPAFKLKTNEMYQVEGHKAPVVKLYEKDGLKVYATPYEGDLNGLDASKAAAELSPDKNPSVSSPEGYTAVVMPKVDMNRVAEVEWLKGMTNSKGFQIDQALAQAMVQMDQNGFKAKEALAIATSRGIAPADREFKMDKPFLFWVEKDGVKQPIYATKVDQKYWKDPKAEK